MNIKKYIIICSLLFALLSFAGNGQNDPLQQKASIRSIVCSQPRVAMTDNRIIFVWRGYLENRSRILFREKSDSDWSQEIPIDRTEWGNNSDPALALDEKGNPHIVWSFCDEEVSVIYYTRRIENNWLTPVVIRQLRGKNCEFPCIAIQPSTNRVFVAWQEGRGSLYSIHAAVEDGKGRFPEEQISPSGRQGFYTSPQIFISDEPVMLWFGSASDDFSLYAARFISRTEKWMSYKPDGLENLPCNLLPQLSAGEDGNLHAVWYDSDGNTDRIYYGRQYDENKCIGTIVEQNQNNINNLPFLSISPAGRAGLCWRGESISGGQIFYSSAKINNGITFNQPQMVSDGRKLFYTEPVSALNDKGDAVIVWTSHALDGGDGGVYFCHIKSKTNTH